MKTANDLTPKMRLCITVFVRTEARIQGDGGDEDDDGPICERNGGASKEETCLEKECRYTMRGNKTLLVDSEKEELFGSIVAGLE